MVAEMTAVESNYQASFIESPHLIMSFFYVNVYKLISLLHKLFDLSSFTLLHPTLYETVQKR